MESKIEEKSKEIKLPPIWSTTTLYYAIDWWKRNGNFNQELYEKIVEIKYNLNLNK